jgi:hypothetical protein
MCVEPVTGVNPVTSIDTAVPVVGRRVFSLRDAPAALTPALLRSGTSREQTVFLHTPS